MRFLISLILISGAFLCFLAGYFVGKNNREQAALAEVSKVKTVDPQASETPSMDAEAEAETVMEAPEPDETLSDRFRLRAQESTITLTDTQGRTLQGELLETREEQLELRRYSDDLVVDVPVSMLSREDQAFAAYLFEEGILVNKPETKPQLDLKVEQDNFTGPSISVDLSSKRPQENGLSFLVEYPESENDFAKIIDGGVYQGKKHMFFKVTEPAFKSGKLPLVKLSIEYYDSEKDIVYITYDSKDKYAPRDGAFKMVWAFNTFGTKQLKTAEIILEDVNFDERMVSADFRIESSRNEEGHFIRTVTVVAADPVSQKANADAYAQREPPVESKTQTYNRTWDDVYALLKPFEGPAGRNIDRESVLGKVVTGYQGWFHVPGDGAGLGFHHYENRGVFSDGSCSIDYWPDVSEYPKEAVSDTSFRHQDGRVAQVFTSQHPGVVDTHFRWMKESGIHGAFLQRFLGPVTTDVKFGYARNRVLNHVRAAANKHGRTWVVMYDTSRVFDATTLPRFKKDWMMLVDNFKVGRDPNDKAYQYHNGKPLVVLWGLFEGREGCPEFFLEAVDFVKNDPKYGGYSVMVGGANDWRTGNTPGHKIMRKVIEMSDIVSPWTPGRYHNHDVRSFIQRNAVPDIKWLEQRDIDYLPVVYPGFSWYNMKLGKQGHIRRDKGQFLWDQVYHNYEAGARMLYLAMFDEIDEGTQFFKVSDDPPVGHSKFLTYDGVPSDHYMWLGGKAQELMRGDLDPSPMMPSREGVELPLN